MRAATLAWTHPRALAGPDGLDLDAEALLLLELNSQTMVYAKNIDTRREPASLTKVMTCLLALEHGNLTDSITVSQEALDDLDPPAAAPVSWPVRCLPWSSCFCTA